ncbi:MAG: hypothetical protein C4287_02880 [Leptolyngbya sp. ERB_1_2]
MSAQVIVDPGRATQRPYGVAIYNSNLISTLSDIAPQDIELRQLSLADPGEVLPGWHVPSGALPKLRIPMFRSLVLAVAATLRPAADLLLLRRSDSYYHALVPEEGLPVDPERRIVSVHGLESLSCSGSTMSKANLAVRSDSARRSGAGIRGASDRIFEYVAASRAIVTTSSYLAEHLTREVGIDPAKISVIPGGVDHTRFFPREESEVEEIVSRYSLRRPYAVSVADSGASARLVDVEAVADRVWRKERVEVVIVGTSRGRRPGTRRLGYVPREHLPALYSGAVAFLTLSKFHGFPLSVLESLACGTPVVAVRSEGMIEAVGDHAFLVEEGDVDRATDGVLKFLEKRFRKKASLEGIEHARKFSWYKTALATLDLYRRIVSGGAAADMQSDQRERAIPSPQELE